MATTTSCPTGSVHLQSAYYNNNTPVCNTPNVDYYYNNNIADGSINRAYLICYGRQIPPNIAAQIVTLIDLHHIDPAMICDIIEYSLDAPQPSWRYARAVINAKIREGITTLDAWRASLDAWQLRSRKHMDQRYAQRDYDDRYDGLTAEQLEEMSKL